MRISRLVAAAVVGLAGASVAQAVPTTVTFTARLADNGTPVQGSKTFAFKLFPAASGGTSVWSESQTLLVTSGDVNAELGTTTPLDDTVLSGAKLWLEVTVDGTVLSPRTPVVSVPYAVRAGTAGKIGTLAEADLQRRVTGTCAPGSSIRTIDSAGAVTCQTAAVTVNTDGGTNGITGVYGGAGLTGGGAIGDINLAVSFAGSGTAATAARSDHTHTGTYLPVGPTLACTGTDKVTGISATTGAVTCSPDTNTTYSPAPSAGISISASNQIGLVTCPLNNVLKSVGSTWSCQADAIGTGTVTAVTASGPLSSSGGTAPAITLGTVGLANGGTGLTVSGAAGSYLRSTGSTWASSPILAADVPDLSASYISNQSASSQVATMYINGTIRTDGLIRAGSETGTAEAPVINQPAGAAYKGMIVRPLVSQYSSLNNIIARTDVSALIRDGSGTSGMRFVKLTGDSLQQFIACQGFSSSGAAKVFQGTLAPMAASTAWIQVFTGADDVTFLVCNFGGVDGSVGYVGHHTTLTMSRVVSSGTWFGTLESTFNQ